MSDKDKLMSNRETILIVGHMDVGRSCMSMIHNHIDRGVIIVETKEQQKQDPFQREATMVIKKYEVPEVDTIQKSGKELRRERRKKQK